PATYGIAHVDEAHGSVARDPNPRIVKTFLNSLCLAWNISGKRGVAHFEEARDFILNQYRSLFQPKRKELLRKARRNLKRPNVPTSPTLPKPTLPAPTLGDEEATKDKPPEMAPET
ncbi:MAG: hypothetical protein AAF517_24130, partial [Planctomycetota bacterium]